MSYEFNSYINGAVARIFIQNPLMNAKNMTKIIHNHKYVEFHMVFGGSIKMLIDNKKYTFSSGTVYSIPQRVYHCCIDIEPQAQIVAFQAEIGLNAFEQHSVNEMFIKEIISILSKESFCSSCSEISPLFSLSVSEFFKPIQMKPSKDYALLIYEFISQNYNQNITVSELAKNLYLSDKQTERVTKKHSGYTLKKAIANYRMKISDFLEENTDMNKSEISKYVGYSNYSGYWKAKKYLCGDEDSF